VGRGNKINISLRIAGGGTDKMAETKYGKYIVSKPKIKPPESGTGTVVIDVDGEVIEGAFYLNCALIWAASDEGAPPIRHSHDDYDEYVCFMGTNPEDPHDLGGEVEIWLDDEKHMITKSSAVWIPKGLMHCPVYFRRVDRPIVYFSTAPSTTYSKDLPKK
jgi:hypothetical protein